MPPLAGADQLIVVASCLEPTKHRPPTYIICIQAILTHLAASTCRPSQKLFLTCQAIDGCRRERADSVKAHLSTQEDLARRHSRAFSAAFGNYFVESARKQKAGCINNSLRND